MVLRHRPGRGLLLGRITLAPGAELPRHAYPVGYALFAESGELSVAISEGFAGAIWAGQSAHQMVGPAERIVLRAQDSPFGRRAVARSG